MRWLPRSATLHMLVVQLDRALYHENVHVPKQLSSERIADGAQVVGSLTHTYFNTKLA